MVKPGLGILRDFPHPTFFLLLLQEAAVWLDSPGLTVSVKAKLLLETEAEHGTEFTPHAHTMHTWEHTHIGAGVLCL